VCDRAGLFKRGGTSTNYPYPVQTSGSAGKSKAWSCTPYFVRSSLLILWPPPLASPQYSIQCCQSGQRVSDPRTLVPVPVPVPVPVGPEDETTRNLSGNPVISLAQRPSRCQKEMQRGRASCVAVSEEHMKRPHMHEVHDAHSLLLSGVAN
jgi:hypothetical protein